MNIKDRIKRIYSLKCFPFIVFFGIMLFLHLFLNFGTDDDLFFSEVINKNNIFEWTKLRFETWTSRSIIEFFLVIILKIGYPLMKFLNVVVYTLFAYAISKLFIDDNKDKNRLNIILCLLILVIPFNVLKSAGYSATMINYLWPITFALISFIPIKNAFCDKKNNIILYIISILLLLFAVNQEQVAIIVLIMDILFLIASYICKKKIKVYLYVSLIITIISLIIIFVVCKGNMARSISSINYWYKDYQMLDFIDKIQVSITSMMYYMVFRVNYIYIIFNAIVCYYMFIRYNAEKSNNGVKKIIAVFPLVVSLIFSIFNSYVSSIFNFTNFTKWYLESRVAINVLNCCYWKSYIVMAIYLMSIFCNFVCIVILFKDYKKIILNFVILFCGYISRFSLGFSPTVFASSERTSIFLYYSFIIIILNLIIEYKYNEKSSIILPKGIIYFIYYSVIINLINTLR